MQSRARLLGLPIHSVLIAFPFGLLATAVIFDIVHLLTDDPAMAVVAAPFGTIDWLAIPEGTRAKSDGLRHGLRDELVGRLGVGVDDGARLDAPCALKEDSAR